MECKTLRWHKTNLQVCAQNEFEVSDVSGIRPDIVGIYMGHDMQIYTDVCTHTHTYAIKLPAELYK